MTSGSTSFSSLDGIGSNIHVVGLDDLTSLYNSSSPIVENEWNCSSGDLQCTHRGALTSETVLRAVQRRLFISSDQHSTSKLLRAQNRFTHEAVLISCYCTVLRDPVRST